MNIISLQTRRNNNSDRLKYVVALVLARGQSLIVGSSKPQARYEELKEMFPNAELELNKWGVKICAKKK